MQGILIPNSGINRLIRRLAAMALAVPAGAQAAPFHAEPRHAILSALADPNLAFLLLIAGILGIYAEFCAPGRIAPGVLGGVCVLVAVYSLSLLPISRIGVALLILAGILLILDAKVSTRGTLGAGGALAMIVGAVLLVDSHAPGARIHWITAVCATLPFTVITVFLLRAAARARRNKAIDAGQATGPMNPAREPPE